MPKSVPAQGVLVAVDGSPESDAAVRWAADEAMMHDLPVTLMHVVAPVVVTWPVRYLQDGYRRWQEDHAKQVIEQALKCAQAAVSGSGTAIRTEVRHGGVAAELVGASRKATLVVAGSRGLGAVGAGLLGSVSRVMLHYARSPVAIIHASDSRADSTSPVLLGVDGSAASEAATGLAFDEASRRRVDLVALHAWSDVSVVPALGPEWGAVEQEGGEVLAERLAGWQERYPDVRVHRRIVCDRPAHWMIEESAHAQLVVLGRRGRGGFARLLLGSVSTAVAESSPAPVIVVPGGSGDPVLHSLDAK